MIEEVEHVEWRLMVDGCVWVQVYLQKIKLDDCGDSDINWQLDRLVEISEFYAAHWHELSNVPVDNIAPGTAVRL